MATTPCSASDFNVFRSLCHSHHKTDHKETGEFQPQPPGRAGNSRWPVPGGPCGCTVQIHQRYPWGVCAGLCARRWGAVLVTVGRVHT